MGSVEGNGFMGSVQGRHFVSKSGGDTFFR